MENKDNLTFREIRELAKARICYELLNRVPEMSTGDFATRLLGILETEFKYRIYMPAPAEGKHAIQTVPIDSLRPHPENKCPKCGWEW